MEPSCPNPENSPRKELFDLIRQIQTEANLDPDEAERLAAEAVAAVRESRAARPPGDQSPGYKTQAG
jgi:hypothetical protein